MTLDFTSSLIFLKMIIMRTKNKPRQKGIVEIKMNNNKAAVAEMHILSIEIVHEGNDAVIFEMNGVREN